MKSVKKYRLIPIDQVETPTEEPQQPAGTENTTSSDSIKYIDKITEEKSKEIDKESEEISGEIDTANSQESTDIASKIPPPGKPIHSISEKEAAKWQPREGEKSQKDLPLEKVPAKLKRKKPKPKWIKL